MGTVFYDGGKICAPFGLKNQGSLCYFNSVIQSMMTCTSVVDLFLEKKKTWEDEKNEVALEFVNLINQPDQKKDASPLIKKIIEVSRRSNPGKTFGRGQEDSGECLLTILDTIDDEELYSYFNSRYLVNTWCLKCSSKLSVKEDNLHIVQIPPVLCGTEKKGGINSHIKQNVSVLEDYKCRKCSKSSCCRIYQLTRSPNVMTVMFNKFFKKKEVNFPQELAFPGIDRPFLRYKLVSKIEHIGNSRGGHYISHCLRSEREKKVLQEQICLFNDMRISAGNFLPTRNTYMLFYHIIA